MFEKIWAWAGKLRKSATSIDVASGAYSNKACRTCFVVYFLKFYQVSG